MAQPNAPKLALAGQQLYRTVRLVLRPSPTRQDPDNHVCLVVETMQGYWASTPDEALKAAKAARGVRRPWELAIEHEGEQDGS